MDPRSRSEADGGHDQPSGAGPSRSRRPGDLRIGRTTTKGVVPRIPARTSSVARRGDDGTDEAVGRTFAHDASPDPSHPTTVENHLDRARRESPQVHGDVDGARFRQELKAQVKEDLARSWYASFTSRHHREAIEKLIDVRYSDDNLKKVFEAAVDGRDTMEYTTRFGSARHLVVEAVTLKPPAEFTTGTRDIEHEGTERSTEQKSSNERSPLYTEPAFLRIPTPVVLVQARLPGLVNTRGAELSAESSHADRTTLTEKDVPSRIGRYDVEFTARIESSRPSLVTPHTLGLPLAWRTDGGSSADGTSRPGEWPAGDRPTFGRISGLPRVVDEVGREIAFKKGDPEVKRLREWLADLSTGRRLFDGPQSETFRFRGQRRPATVEVQATRFRETRSAPRAAGTVKNERTWSGTVKDTLTRKRWRGFGVQVAFGDLTGFSGFGAGPIAMRYNTTTIANSVSDKVERTSTRTFDGDLQRHVTDVDLQVRVTTGLGGSDVRTTRPRTVAGHGTVWTRTVDEVGPEPRDAGTDAGADARAAAAPDRVASRFDLPGDTASRLADAVIGQGAGRRAPSAGDATRDQLRVAVQDLLQAGSRDMVRGAGLRVPLGRLLPGASDVFVHGRLGTDGATRLTGFEGERATDKIATSHDRTSATTWSKDWSGGVVAQGFRDNDYSTNQVTYKDRRGTEESATQRLGREQTVPEGDVEAFRFGATFDVRPAPRWSATQAARPDDGGDGHAGTPVTGSVDVSGPRQRGAWTEPTASATGTPGGWSDGAYHRPAGTREGLRAPDAELEVLRPSPDITREAAGLFRGGRAGRLGRLLVGRAPAAVDEPRRQTRVGPREGLSRPRVEDNAALDALEQFTGTATRTARYGRAAAHQDSVALRTDNEAGLVGTRDLYGRLDLSHHLESPRLAGKDPDHTFTRTDYTATETTSGRSHGRGFKAKAGFAALYEIRGWLNAGVVTASNLQNVRTSKSSTNPTGEARTTTTYREPAYLVSYDRVDALHGLGRHSWQDPAGFRHSSGRTEHRRWSRVPDGVREWVPASQIDRVGVLRAEDVAALDEPDRQRYLAAHPEPGTSGAARPPLQDLPVDMANSRLDLYRPEIVRELVGHIETHLDSWMADKWAPDSTAAARPDARRPAAPSLGRVPWFGEMRQELIERVLGLAADPAEFSAALEEMRSGGLPFHLHANTPFGNIEQTVVLKLDSPTQGRPLPSGPDRTVTDELTSETGSTQGRTSTWGSEHVANAAFTVGRSEDPAMFGSLGVGAEATRSRGDESGSKTTDTSTSRTEGRSEQWVHDAQFSIAVHPLQRSGTLTARVAERMHLTPGRTLTTPWSRAFPPIRDALRSTAVHSPRADGPPHDRPSHTPAGRRGAGTPTRFDPAARVHPRPMNVPGLHRVLGELTEGRDRPGLSPGEANRVYAAFSGAVLRSRFTDLTRRGGHAVEFNHGKLRQLRVELGLGRRTLVDVLDGALTTKTETEDTAKLAGDWKIKGIAAGALDFRTPAIGDTAYRPTVGLADSEAPLGTVGRDHGHEATSEGTTHDSTKDAGDGRGPGGARRRYLVEVVPQWKVTPVYRSSRTPARHSRALTSSGDRPLLLEVNEQGLRDLGLQPPGQVPRRRPLPTIAESSRPTAAPTQPIIPTRASSRPPHVGDADPMARAAARAAAERARNRGDGRSTPRDDARAAARAATSRAATSRSRPTGTTPSPATTDDVAVRAARAAMRGASEPTPGAGTSTVHPDGRSDSGSDDEFVDARSEIDPADRSDAGSEHDVFHDAVAHLDGTPYPRDLALDAHEQEFLRQELRAAGSTDLDAAAVQRAYEARAARSFPMPSDLPRLAAEVADVWRTGDVVRVRGGAGGLEAELHGIGLRVPEGVSYGDVLVESPHVSVAVDHGTGGPIAEVVTAPIAVVPGDLGRATRDEVLDAVDDVVTRLRSGGAASLARLFAHGPYVLTPDGHETRSLGPRTAGAAHEGAADLHLHFSVGVPVTGLADLLHHELDDGAFHGPRSEVAREYLRSALDLGRELADRALADGALATRSDHRALAGFLALTHVQFTALAHTAVTHEHPENARNFTGAFSRVPMAQVRAALGPAARAFVETHADELGEQMVRAFRTATPEDGPGRADLLATRLPGRQLGGPEHTLREFVDGALRPGAPSVGPRAAFGVGTELAELDHHRLRADGDEPGVPRLDPPLVVVELRHHRPGGHSLDGLREVYDELATVVGDIDTAARLGAHVGPGDRFVDPERWARELVPAVGGRPVDGLEQALAVHETFHGRPTPRVALPGGDPVALPGDPSRPGAPFVALDPAPDALARLLEAVRDAGHGASAVLHGTSALEVGGEPVRTSWNVVHHDGRVLLVDPRTGGVTPATDDALPVLRDARVAVVDGSGAPVRVAGPRSALETFLAPQPVGGA